MTRATGAIKLRNDGRKLLAGTPGWALRLDKRTIEAVRTRTVAIKTLFARISSDRVAIGRLLIEVKERLDHGQFGRWLADEFQIDHRVANEAMQIARAFPKNGVSKGFDAKALLSLSGPDVPQDARREALTHARNGERVTRAVAKEIIEKHATARPRETPIEATLIEPAESAVHFPPGPHKPNPHGVYERADVVKIPFRKTSGITAEVYLAHGEDGLWRWGYSWNIKRPYQGSSGPASVSGGRYRLRLLALVAALRDLQEWLRAAGVPDAAQRTLIGEASRLGVVLGPLKAESASPVVEAPELPALPPAAADATAPGGGKGRTRDRWAERNDFPREEPAAPGATAWEIETGDCLTVLPAIAAGSVRLIIADPPYNIGVDYGDGAKDDLREPEEYVRWVSAWINALYPVLTEDGSFWLIISQEFAAECVWAAKETGFHLRDWITWYETFGTNCTTKFNRTSRFIIRFDRSPDRNVWHPEAVNRASDRQTKYNDPRANPDGKVWDDVWTNIPRLVGNATERLPAFPTQLPVDLILPIVGCASDPGDLVLDPFNGSGTTGAAALRLGRRYHGIELRPRFAELSRQRLSKAEWFRGLVDDAERPGQVAAGVAAKGGEP